MQFIQLGNWQATHSAKTRLGRTFLEEPTSTCENTPFPVYSTVSEQVPQVLMGILHMQNGDLWSSCVKVPSLHCVQPCSALPNSTRPANSKPEAHGNPNNQPGPNFPVIFWGNLGCGCFHSVLSINTFPIRSISQISVGISNLLISNSLGLFKFVD